jgi:hypothetical protein
MTDNSRRELKSPGYEIFIGMLSILSILNIILMYLVADPNLDTVIDAINWLLSIIFLADFTYRLLTAQSKTRYFFAGFGWADLLTSLPLPQAKVFRIFRLLSVFRLLRNFGPKRIARSLLRDRAGSALFSLLLVGLLVFEFGSLAILNVEQYAHGANITSASDALWYVIVTISTVGYGDLYPVTKSGRLIGTGIIIIGVGIFGTFTGYLANLFIGPSKTPDVRSLPSTDPQAKVDQLRRLMTDQQNSIDELERILRAE